MVKYSSGRPSAGTSPQLELSYVLPLRRDAAGPAPVELTRYLTWLAGRVDLSVVDNSEPEVFAANAQAWGQVCRHVRPEPDLDCRHHKVANVLTGLRLAEHDLVVVADDDVRWDDAGLQRALAMGRQADLILPQNYFAPCPWHACWDTARTLVNRAIGADFPGTLVVRRAVLDQSAGYDGNTLFENLELIRTVEAIGGRVVHAPDFFVRRLPPATSRFWSQRVRQAYDDFALPMRMAVWLSLAPVCVALCLRHRRGVVASGAAVSVMVAEFGRRRAEGRRVFPVWGSALAPAWLAERAVCAWLAVGTRLVHGGVRYNGTVLRCAAHSRQRLRRRVAGLSPEPALVGAAG